MANPRDFIENTRELITTPAITKTEIDAGLIDDRYYTETELNAGQLDNRYYTETEVNTLIDGAGSVLTYVSKTTTYTAVANDYIFADTSVAVFTITMPLTPALGDTIFIIDNTSSFATNNLTVNGNGSAIHGVGDVVLDVDNLEYKFVFNGTEWRVR